MNYIDVGYPDSFAWRLDDTPIAIKRPSDITSACLIEKNRIHISIPFQW